MKLLKVLETYFLKPLQVLYYLLFFYALFNKFWFLLVFIVLMIFYVGWIGGAVINEGKTFKELTKGSHPKLWDENSGEYTPEETRQFSRAIVHLMYVLILSLTVLAISYGYKIYLSIIFGLILGYILSSLIIEPLVIYIAKKSKWA